MKKLDPRSVLIGFLVAVIGFMSLGAVNTTFDSITVGEIKMKNNVLDIRSPNGRMVMTLTGNPIYHGAIYWSSQGGKVLSQIGQSDNGGGSLSIHNRAGDETVLLGNSQPTADDNGGGRISILSSHKETIVQVGETIEQDGYVALSDRYGEIQWIETGKRP